MTGRALLLWASMMVLAAGPSGAWSAEPEVVARVNGEPVMRAELQRMLADSLTRRLYQRELGVQKADSQELVRWALRKLIIQRLTLQEAARRNFTVGERDLDEAVAGWRGRYKGKGKFQRWLKSRALDEKTLRETIRADLLIGRVRAELEQGVRLTDEQVQEYYEAHKAKLQAPEEVWLRIIAAKTKGEAEEIMAALRKGEDFERLARERPMGPRGAEVGDMRWVTLQSLPPPLREAVGTLKPGEISGPLQGGAEMIIVRLEERRPARTKTVAEARPEIERRLLPAKQREVIQAWLADQEKKAKIEVFLPDNSLAGVRSVEEANAVSFEE